MKTIKFSLLFTCILFFATNTHAGQVEVVDARAKSLGENQYRFDVTLQHKDAGWDHYANRWEILDSDGNILATRTLYHPHVNEQPFTRSLTATIPATHKKVIIRGHDSEHQYGKKTITLSLP